MQRILILLLFFFIPFLGKSERKKVLVFHSYHQGLEWTDNVTRGIKRAFESRQDSVELFFEYLDRKRNLSNAYYEELERLYELKPFSCSHSIKIGMENLSPSERTGSLFLTI